MRVRVAYFSWSKIIMDHLKGKIGDLVCLVLDVMSKICRILMCSNNLMYLIRK